MTSIESRERSSGFSFTGTVNIFSSCESVTGSSDVKSVVDKHPAKRKNIKIRINIFLIVLLLNIQ